MSRSHMIQQLIFAIESLPAVLVDTEMFFQIVMYVQMAITVALSAECDTLTSWMITTEAKS